MRGKRAIVEVNSGVLCEKAWANEWGAALVDVLRRGTSSQVQNKKRKQKVFGGDCARLTSPPIAAS